MEIEIKPEGKNFRMVSDDELPKILETLEKYLPYSMKFHQTIKTYLNHRVWPFYFYVAKSWPDEETPVFLHIPGCTSTPNNHESFGFFCPIDELDYVEMIKTEDVLFDWSLPKYLNYVHVDIVDRLEMFMKNIGKVERIQGEVYLCKIDPDSVKLGELPSNEAELRPLRLEDSEEIHELYPANDIESVEIFKSLAEKLPGYGIYTTEGDELAAWMVQSYYGAMFSMQTKPEHRRRGYGILLAQNLAKHVIKRGYMPFVLIRHENEASQSLYKKLGFEKIFDMARIVFTPYEFIKDHECDDNCDDKEEKNGHEQNGNHAKDNGNCNGVNNHHHNI